MRSLHQPNRGGWAGSLRPVHAPKALTMPAGHILHQLWLVFSLILYRENTLLVWCGGWLPRHRSLSRPRTLTFPSIKGTASCKNNTNSVEELRVLPSFQAAAGGAWRVPLPRRGREELAGHRITESQNSRGWKGPLWVI